MAHIESGGGGRKTSLEINLVPFIDLMSVLITFLLITAVWTQVSMIQIGSSIYGKKTETQTQQLPPDVEIPLKLEIKSNGYILTVAKDIYTIPFKSGDFDDQSLIEQLSKLKEKYPQKADGAIAMADELPYERLIHGMDIFIKAGIPQISILTGGPN